MKKRGVTCGLIILAAAAMVIWGGTQALAAERVAVKAPVANLRNGAGTAHQVLWQVEKYHPFVVVRKNGDWLEVKDFEGDTAWIHDSLLDKTNTVVTVKANCNVRKEPTTKSEVVLKVERGVPFKVVQQKGNWIKIEHADGESGWIHRSLVW